MSSAILSPFIIRQSPFIDDPDWFYTLHSPSDNVDLRHICADSLPPPPSLTIDINFTTLTISGLRNHSDEQEPESRTETKRFVFDTWDFNQPFSAEQLINSMFMNTSTGRSLPIERRRWLVADISGLVTSLVGGGICVAYDEMFICLDVVELVMPQGEEYLIDEILRESFEDHSDLSARPAPQALLESLVTGVFGHEEEAVSCMVCLEELVVGAVVKSLPCSHRFHGDCIDGWFAWRDSCPLCRFTLGA